MARQEMAGARCSAGDSKAVREMTPKAPLLKSMDARGEPQPFSLGLVVIRQGGTALN